MNYYFDPTQGDKRSRAAYIGDIYYYLIHCAELSEKTGKPFEVSFSDKKPSKSYEQIKAIHLLCTKLIPHLSKEHNADYSLENVKDFVKREFDYMRKPTKFEAGLMFKTVIVQLKKEAKKAKEEYIELNPQERKEAFNFCKKIKQPKSFAGATKEEMFDLIKEIEAWAAEKGWPDVFLESREIEALVKFYDNLK